MRKTMLLGLTLALATGLAACGGDEPSASDSTTTTTEASTTTTTAGAPCGGAATIVAAVEASPVAGLNEVTSVSDVVDVRVAASDPTWGGFSDVPSPGNESTFQGGYGVVHCDASGWVVYDAGSDQVGCGGGTIPEVPATVRTDLGLECAT